MVISRSSSTRRSQNLVFLADQEQHAEQFQPGLVAEVGGTDLLPGRGIEAALRLLLLQEFVELEILVPGQPEFLPQGAVEGSACCSSSLS